MKKVFTFLSVLATALFASPTFADGVDVTDKLANPNFDEGIAGWNVEFTTKDNVNGYQWVTIHDHNEARGQGYFGMTAPTLFLETPQGVSPNASRASQKLTGLENGTYVFSAIASFATRYLDLLANGAYIFANDDKVEGCNYNPYYNFNNSVPQAHTKRYQVATIVTDGTLEVGFCTIDGAGTYNTDADNCELWYFGDVKEDEALVEMGKIHMNQLKAISDSLINGPITTDGAATLQSVVELTADVSTAEEYCWAEDTLRIANYVCRVNETAKMGRLLNAIEQAKEYANGEYSEYVATYQAQLKALIEVYEKDIEAHMIPSDKVDTYVNALSELISQIKTDDLYLLADQLYTFVMNPSEISEENPLFGITEHPGFGEEEGQYPTAWHESLFNLYNEVNWALGDVEDGVKTAAEVMVYFDKINNAVAECIRSATTTYTLPYDWIAMPSENDPTVPNTTIKDVNNGYIRANFWYPTTYYGESHNDGIFRLQTPMMKFDKPYKQITLTVTATVGNQYNTTNDGPYFGVQEMYVLDGNGEEMPLTAENLSCNSMYPHPASSLGGLVDHKLHYNTSMLSQFLTNGQSQENRGNHYIRVNFPEPVSEAKFIFEMYYNNWWLQNVIFSRMTISGVTEEQAILSDAVSDARSIVGTYQFGLEPSNYPVHDDELKALTDQGDAMLAEGTASTAEMKALAEKIVAAYEVVKGTEMLKAVDGKEYYISQEFGGFATNQGYKKNLTVFQDSILWFDDAKPADKNQKWILTSVEGDRPDDGYDWYYIKNVGTGKYMSTLISGQAWEPTGEPINWGENYMKLSDKPAKVRIEYVNWGQLRIYCMNEETTTYMRMCVPAHNNGERTDDPVADGGTSAIHPDGYSLNGVCGVVRGDNSYNGGANTNYAWAFHEVINTLPATIELGEKFGDETRHFATASNVFTFTADKPCAFENFLVYNYRENGRELPCTVARTSNAISVTFPVKWADFRFSFDNKEGVKQLTVTTEEISGDVSVIEKLLEIYNATLQSDFEEGTEVGNIKDLTALSEAMENAGSLLENGASEEQYQAALTALEEALAGIETIQPEEGKKYVIVNGYDAFIRSGQPVEYGIYFNALAGAPGWTYLLADNENYQWEFIRGEEEGTWYIKNVASASYLGAPSAISEIYGMSTTPVPYEIISRGGSRVNIRCTVEGSNENWNVHQNGWNRGFGNFGSVVVYNDEQKSRWYIREVEDIPDGIVTLESETGRPAREGIFDLTGRRVSSPASGLYIINGKKVLIK